MTSLNDIQSAFLDSIYDSYDVKLAGQVTDKKIETDQRLRIYKDNVRLNLYNNLKSKYDAVCQIVGEDFFKYLANEYVKNNKPVSGNLDEYGEEFANFISGFDAVAKLQYLADLARLEWAVHIAYFAANSAELDKLALAKVSPEKISDIKFRLSPSANILFSDFQIDKIYEFAKNPDGVGEFNLNKPSVALVYRPVLKTEILPISKAEGVCLQAIEHGDNLYDAYEQATHSGEIDIGEFIQKFVLNGVFVGFSLQRF